MIPASPDLVKQDALDRCRFTPTVGAGIGSVAMLSGSEEYGAVVLRAWPGPTCDRMERGRAPAIDKEVPL